MEVWIGKADQEHAENQRGALPPQPLHHLDGSHQEAIPGDQSGEISGKDEVPSRHEV